MAGACRAGEERHHTFPDRDHGRLLDRHGKAILGIAQSFISFLLDGIAKLLDWLSGIPLIGDEIGKGAKEVQSWADGVRAASDENKRASADLLTPAFDKAGNRMRETFENIGNALSEGFTKGNSLIDTSDWERTARQRLSTNAERKPHSRRSGNRISTTPSAA